MGDFLKHIDNTWTLFLDRDGVININKEDGYVQHRGEFIFTEGAIEAICRLGQIFDRIIVVTNQRGIGKGLMTAADLEDIHAYLIKKIGYCGGRIDAIFYCPEDEDTHPDRKPNPGMAYKAKEMFPDIDFEKSVMVGDKEIDILWGKNIGAHTVRIAPAGGGANKNPSIPKPDLTCPSLFDFMYKVIQQRW